MARPLNYSTTVSAAKTAAECQALLAEAGAASVAVHYEDKEPAGLSFTLKTPHGTRAFSLPVDVAGAHLLIRDMLSKNPPHMSRAQLDKLGSRKHAGDVAWRVARDWLEASLALVAAGMATVTEIMLPYLVIGDDDRTLWEAYREREQAAIEMGEPGG
jgi:hypothetical protein